MIKKVNTEQLRPGIFVHDFNCDWAGENVFIDKALIKSERTIQIIQSWGIKEVYIDTEKGLDVKDAAKASGGQKKPHSDLHRLTRQNETNSTPVTALQEEIHVARAIRNEAVDTIQKAMQSAQEGKQIDVESAFRLVEKMGESVTRNKDALLLLTRMRKKDEYTLMHSISVSTLVLSFCSAQKFPYEMTINLAMGALFHDIGKTRTPDSILNKPGKLNQKELAIMKRHSEYSAAVLAETTELPHEAYDIALHHHERYDGSGYPHGLKGNTISFGSRLAAICDVYDAITSVRCYKYAIDRVAGLRKIYEWSGHHFDRELAYKFIQHIGVYPVGTHVKLENGLSGIVVESTDNILQPVVHIFYDDRQKTPVQPLEINLSIAGINISSYDPPEEWSNDKTQNFTKHKTSLSPFL